MLKPRRAKSPTTSIQMSRGDIVGVTWYDTHSSERLTRDEAEQLEDPGFTLAYGVVLRNGPRHLTIASELCMDTLSDVNWIEQIPHGAICGVRHLGRKPLS